MDEVVAQENHHHCVLLAHPTFWRHWLADHEAEVTDGMSGGCWFYAIRFGNTDCYKVGITGGSVQRRLAQLQTGSPQKLTVYNAYLLPNRETARAVEKMALREFGDVGLQVRGEWVYHERDNEYGTEFCDFLRFCVCYASKVDPRNILEIEDGGACGWASA